MFRIDKDSRVKLQTNIDVELHHLFKKACFLQGKGMNEVLTELISGWLRSLEELEGKKEEGCKSKYMNL